MTDNQKLIDLINSVKMINSSEEIKLFYSEDTYNKLKELRDYKCTKFDKIDESKIFIIPIKDIPIKIYFE